MLLNLSNHPSSSWPEKQTQEAEKEYGPIQDMPFPHIDPKSDDQQIRELAQIYLDQIITLKPAAVHLMGELTFTFALVELLKSHGIPCLASTTTRNTEDLPEGKKITHFQFVRFRNY
jgi:hypothetical protein